MQTQSLIRASADVVTIATVRPGDVYKRLDKTYTGATELKFGIVQSVMNNGSDSAFTALEFSADYSGASVAIKTFSAGADLAIFAATPDEVRAHLDEIGAAAQRAAKAAEDDLAKKRNLAAQIEGITVNSASLTQAVTAAVTAD